MLRIIREEEPPKPSTRLSDSERIARLDLRFAQTEPAKLTKLVRGELDWIVMKALEKDRVRRYESASALAADLQRYLLDEPVEACPPSPIYRVRKFASRHRRTSLTAAAFVGLLLVATLVSTRLAYEGRRAENRAMTQASLAKEAAQTGADGTGPRSRCGKCCSGRAADRHGGKSRGPAFTAGKQVQGSDRCKAF